MAELDEPVRVFLLSPARASGKRAEMLLRPTASFPLARALRSKAGAPLGEVFAFISGLYFRGKLAYARAFEGQAFVITPCLGLVPIVDRIGVETLRTFAEIDIHHEDDRFRGPLLRDARRLEMETDGRAGVVLLGSIASKKYVEILTDVFGERLLFPKDFVGRGDMSRGGLMLRASRSRRELEYASVLGAELHGARPPRLEPTRRDTNLWCQPATRRVDEWPHGPGEGAKRPEATNDERATRGRRRMRHPQK